MATSISNGAIAPISSDLTAENLKMQVIRGWESMIRADRTLASGVTINTGDWCKLDAAGEVIACTTSPVAHSFLCIAGKDRFDAHGTGKVTLCMSRSGVQVKTNNYANDTYAVGDHLTAKTTDGKLSKQANTEPKLGRVLEVGSGYLVYEMLSGH